MQTVRASSDANVEERGRKNRHRSADGKQISNQLWLLNSGSRSK